VPTDPLPPWVLEVRQQVGDRVREERTARGWSQEQLAHAASLDRKTIYRIERAQYGTRIDHLVLIAGALGVPVGSLFT
jgi:transcriptional regulator with XRE-family HTH domain